MFSFRGSVAAHLRLFLPVLLTCLLLTGATSSLRRAAGQPATDAAPFVPGSGGRHFYVTSRSYGATEVLSACTPGYHMASLWEILDPSHLTYDSAHPAAYTAADSGHGPPSGWNGWVRTGQSAETRASAGTANCAAWSSTTAIDYGSAVRLVTEWEMNSGEIAAWDASAFPCNAVGPVWCVGDFSVIHLPAVIKQ
jgi:hypothetical protein